MKINTITSFLFEPAKTAGVNIVLDGSGDPGVSYVVVSKKKKSIVTEDTGTVIPLSELSRHLSAGIPLILTLNGKGILHKRSADPGAHEKDIINNMLPNADRKALYVQQYQGAGANTFYSIIRRELITQITGQLQEQGFTVIDFNLGGFILTNILSYLDDPATDDITIDGHRLILSEGLPEAYSYSMAQTHNRRTLIGEPMEENLLLPFAAALKGFQRSDRHDLPDIATAQEEFAYKQAFIKTGWAMLIFIFALLLINFGFYSFLDQDHKELSAGLQQKNAQLLRLEKLESEFSSKNEFITRTGWSSVSALSWYADQIGLSIPRSMKLTVLNLHPLNESKDDKGYVFQNKVINIEGEVQNSRILNDWIRLLKDKEWVSDIVISHYGQEGRGKATFSIELKLSGS